MQTVPSIPLTQCGGNTCVSISLRRAGNTGSSRIHKRERKTFEAGAARRCAELSIYALRKFTINAGWFTT
jgi:hypothetical protein